MEKLNIIQLIENNPITILSREYENKFVNKIQNNFTDTEQNIFLGSFYCYLNYNPEKDFIIDFDSVWKWLGFTRKDNCKSILVLNFKENIHFTIAKKAAPPIPGAGINTGGSGYNKESILLTVDTFKELCLKCNTKKASEIHKYFIKVEKILQEILNEQTDELRLQLKQKDLQLIEHKKDTKNTLLDSFDKKWIVYLIKIRDSLYKFGSSRDIKERFRAHIREIHENIELVYCIESKDHTNLEQKLKDFIKSSEFQTEDAIFNREIAQTELIKIKDVKIIQKQLIKMNIQIVQNMDITFEITKVQYDIEQTKKDTAQILLDTLKLQLQLQETKQETIQKKSEIIPEIIQKEIQEKKKIQELKEIDKIPKKKYIRSAAYMAKINTPEFKELERLRSKKRQLTQEYKDKRSIHYQNNRQRIDEIKLIKKRENSKSTLANSKLEKEKFIDWVKINIKQSINQELIWNKVMFKYLNRITSPRIMVIYKVYFEEYILENFGIILKYSKEIYGYKNFE